MPGNKFQMFCHISCEQCHLPEVAFHGCLPWLPPRIHLPLSNAAWIKGIKTLMQQRLLIIWYNWEEMKINEVEDGEAISWAACTAVFSAWLPWPFLWWGMCKLNIMTNALFPKLFSLQSLKICFSLLRFCVKVKKDRGPHSLLRFLKRCTLSQHTYGSVPVAPAWHSQWPRALAKREILLRVFVPSVPQPALVIPQLQMSLVPLCWKYPLSMSLVKQHPQTMIPSKAKPHSLQLNFHFINHSSF